MSDLPDVDIVLECSLCQQTWSESFGQPIEGIEPRTCDACNKWSFVRGIVCRMVLIGNVGRDDDIAGQLIHAMAEYLDALPEPEGGDATREEGKS